MLVLMTKAPTISDVVASRVRKYRQERGWSVRQLAEKCAEVGATTLTQASITNIERGISATSGRGSRAVSVTELFALAFVMEIPPIMLMLPLGEHNHLEVCPGLTTEPLTALRWMVAGSASKTALSLDLDRAGMPAAYVQASDELLIYSGIEHARELAENVLRAMHADPAHLVQLRRQSEARWEENPTQRAYLELLAKRNNRPLPGQAISDEEFVAQWRELLPRTYRERLRNYADAMWRAVDAGFEVLPPMPRRLYADIMSSFPKSGGIPLDGGDMDDVDPVTGELRESAAPRRPVLPPNIQILDGADDGDR